MQIIRLEKKEKAIKIVNRTGKLRLIRQDKSIRLAVQRPKVRLTHTGKTGPEGPTGLSTFVRVHHQADPNIARPYAQFVEWVGSIAPLNATTEDTWIHTPIA